METPHFISIEWMGTGRPVRKAKARSGRYGSA